MNLNWMLGSEDNHSGLERKPGAPHFIIFDVGTILRVSPVIRALATPTSLFLNSLGFVFGCFFFDKGLLEPGAPQSGQGLSSRRGSRSKGNLGAADSDGPSFSLAV